MFSIKTFTADFVSINENKQADHDPKHLQQVQSSGSLQHYRVSILQIEKKKRKELFRS